MGATTSQGTGPGSVDNIKPPIINGVVRTSNIENGTIINVDVASGAITTSNIASGGINASAISSGTLTNSIIASGAITTSKIASGGINASAISSGTLTNSIIASGAIAQSNILRTAYNQAPVVFTSGNTTLTAESHANTALVLSPTSSGTLTLPAATGTGNAYNFFVNSSIVSGTVMIQVANATDVVAGRAIAASDNAWQSGSPFIWSTASTSDTITLNGTSTGGLSGDNINLIDIVSGKFIVNAFLNQTGTEATPFSATV
jgi:hypothetical protein